MQISGIKKKKKKNLIDKNTGGHNYTAINVILLTIHDYIYSEYKHGRGLTQVFCELEVFEILG